MLVASDIGARGLDIEGVTHIINLDVPEEPTHYLHRAGRCGRKGTSGTAITLVTPYERRWVHKYEKVWGLQFTQKEMSFGKLVDSTKTKKDLEKPKKNKTETKEVMEESPVYQEKQRKKTHPISQKAVTQKKKQKREETVKLGFLAEKAKKKAEKEKNRLQNQKK